MNKEIEEAVLTAEDCIGSFEYYEKDKPEYVKAIKLLQDLAKRYLEIEGFPEIKVATDETAHSCGLCLCNGCEIEGARQAIQDFKLALLKKMDGITPEFLHNKYLKAITILDGKDFNAIANRNYEDLTEGQKYIDKFISEAIKSRLMKG